MFKFNGNMVERCQCRHSSVFIVIFEHILSGAIVATLNKKIIALIFPFSVRQLEHMAQKKCRFF